MVDIFKEVEEDLRRERYGKLWNAYGAYAVGALAALLLGGAGLVGWQKWVETKQVAASQLYEGAVMAVLEDNSAEQRDQLKRIAEADASGYGLLARFHEAAALEQSGDSAAAVALYQGIYLERGVPQGAEIAPVFRDIARIYAALALMDAAAWEEMESVLRPLADSQRAGSLLASEILALSAVEQGRREEAFAIWQRIIETEDASPHMQERVKALLALFETDEAREARQAEEEQEEGK